MSYSFDGVNKIISIASQTAMSVLDIYSRAIDWIVTGDNAKYEFPFKTVGGDDVDVASSTKIPIYAFLRAGWRIKPMESNHTLNVTAGVLLVDGGGDPFINTTGAFVVRVNYSQPVQAITVATGGGGGASANDIWNGLVIEDGYSAAEMLRLIASMIQGDAAGLTSGNPTFLSMDGSKQRLVATYAAGTREIVSRDATP